MSDIQHLERCASCANWGLVGALVLSVVFTGAGIIYARKIGAAKDENMRMAEVRIEQAKASSAKAKEAAAKANEAAASANEKTELVAQQNIKLRIDLEAVSNEARSKQAELAVEQRKLAKAQKELAEAERKRAEAQLTLEKTLEEVRRRQMPRTLTADQRSRLIRALRSASKGEVDITCVLGDGESYALACELKGLLTAAGWPVSEGSVKQAVFTPNNPKGAFVVVRDVQNAPKHAASLQKAFGGAGLPLLTGQDAKLADVTVELRVGNKP